MLKALVGLMHGPISRIPSALARITNAIGPNSSAKDKPWYPGYGSVIVGNLLFCVQSNFPPSTKIPPIDVPCPHIHLVKECTTISAPRSKGRQRYGVLNVASITNGTPASCAIFATSGTSIISKPGFPIISPNTIFVFGLIAFLNPSVSLGFTKVVSIPNRGSVKRNKLTVPPYNCDEDTI